MKNSPRSGLLILLLTLFSKALPQSIYDHEIALIPEKKEWIRFNESEYRAYLDQRYDESFRWKWRYQEFVEDQVSSTRQQFESNEIYTNMVAETAYLTEIIEKTIPKEYLGDNIRVFLVRDPYPNAYCREDGSIFIHAGLIAMYDNEAELAATLCHEFGHYYHRHQLVGYKKYQNTRTIAIGSALTGAYGAIPAAVSVRKLFSDKRAMETQCDDFSVEFFKFNGYDRRAIITDYQKFLAFENKYYSIRGIKKQKTAYATHPKTTDRIKHLSEGVSALPADGLLFQVDEIKFQKLKQKCIDETIYMHFQSGRYHSAIEESYIMHLKNPADQFYIYFLTESLRRAIRFNTNIEKAQFLTSRYNFKRFVPNVSYARSTSVHYNLKELYPLDSVFLSESKNPLVTTDEIEFITYTEALKYFQTVAEKNCSECLFGSPDSSVHLKNPLQKYRFDQMHPPQFSPVSTTPRRPLFFNNVYSAYRGRTDFDVEQIGKSFKNQFSDWTEPAGKAHEFDSLFFYNPELNNRENELISCWLTLCSEKLVNDNFKYLNKQNYFPNTNNVLSADLDLEKDLPELNLVAKKYDYHKIYFLDYTYNGPNPDVSNGKAKYDVFVYCIDVDCKKVYRYSKKGLNKYILFASYQDLNQKIYSFVKEARLIHN